VAALVAARRRECERLSAILHDEITGGLTATGLELDLLAMDAPPEISTRIAGIQQRLEQSFDLVRELSREFHPDPAVRFHFLPALESLAARFERRFAGKLTVSADAETARHVAAAQARALYAVAEAALDNILHHADARTARIGFGSVAGMTYALDIHDDGHGFLESTHYRGTGTAIMEYHVLVAGLELKIQSKIGGGTRVRVSYSGRAEIVEEREPRRDGN
jgi:signal transduction histidine kinase